MLIAFNKPYGVVSQFTDSGSRWSTLKHFGFPRGVYGMGRLDAETEGLLLLSDEGPLSFQLLNPKHGHRRQYWAQVEGIPTSEAMAALIDGVKIGPYQTQPCKAWILDPQPTISPRDPPIRERKSIPDCWIALELTEGKNHQVRRMTAAVGFPTLRLIRIQIGDFELGSLAPGKWREVTVEERKRIMAGATLPPAEAPKPAIARGRRSGQTPPR
jgi:23S rRNA pseudouridine2457 synthase